MNSYLYCKLKGGEHLLIMFFVANLLSPLLYAEEKTALQHKENFLLPYYYESKVNQNRFGSKNSSSNKSSDTMVQLQFSMKYPVYASDTIGLYLAYTQKSNWAVWDEVAYFRDSELNPEIFYIRNLSESLNIAVGADHQSNGGGRETEINWNRGYVNVNYNTDYYNLRVKPWFVISDFSGEGLDVSSYLGNVEFEGAFTYDQRRGLKFLVRNPFSKPYYEVSLTLYGYKGADIYFKYQRGYGTTISNYDFETDAYGVGFSFEI